MSSHHIVPDAAERKNSESASPTVQATWASGAVPDKKRTFTCVQFWVA